MIGLNSYTSQNFQNKKGALKGIYLYTFVPIYELKFKSDMARNLYSMDSTSKQLALNGPAVVTDSKMQNRYYKAPYVVTPID